MVVSKALTYPLLFKCESFKLKIGCYAIWRLEDDHSTCVCVYVCVCVCMCVCTCVCVCVCVCVSQGMFVDEEGFSKQSTHSLAKQSPVLYEKGVRLSFETLHNNKSSTLLDRNSQYKSSTPIKT